MNPLHHGVDDYLALRRRLGFKLLRQETRLHQFVSFMADQKTSRITTALSLEFATREPRHNAKTVSGRLSAIRGFARHWSCVDPTTEIPPTGLLPSGSKPARPYIYSNAEILRLLKGAMNYPTWTRFAGPWWNRCQGWTYYCIFGLLATTGMRIGEVSRLRSEDIDWNEQVITVRNTKFGKSRFVPLHASTVQALATCARHRDRFFVRRRPRPPVQRFFVTSCGTPLSIVEINRVFLRISRQIGLRAADARHGPRIHDLRHRFAIETLSRWYRNGEKVDALLPVLSTYLGHTNVSGTYWYLRCTPELMAAAGGRLEQRWEGIQ